jgi:DNA-binding winged helix-turn-helix (wHTH) protein/tetratricopeptide (TPR) repeat protein
MELLVFLARHSGEVVSKDELLNGVWGTEAVSESALTRSMTELRQALGDLVSEPTIIETIPKRGYRLIAPVSVVEPEGPAFPLPTLPATTPEPAPIPKAQRRALAAGLVILISASLVIAGAAWARVHRTPRLVLTNRQAVLVTRFENRTGEPVLDGTLEYALERELSNSPSVSVVSRDRIEDALRLMRKPTDTAVDLAIGREVCLRDGGIRALVGGRIDKIGDRYRLTAQIVDPANAVAVATLSEDAPGVQALLGAVNREALAIRKTLGQSTESLAEATTRLPIVTTSSIRALQLYSRAADLMPEQSDLAEPYLRDALREDPNFASAHILLAYSIVNSGGRSDEYLHHAREALRLVDPTTIAERHFIAGSVHHFLARETTDQAKHDRELVEAVAEYEAVLGVQPDHFLAANNAGQAYGQLARRDDLANMAGRLVAQRPNSFPLSAGAAQAFLEARGIDAARPYIARAQRLWAALPPESVVHEGERAYVLLFSAHDLWVQRRIKESVAVLNADDVQQEVTRDEDWGFLRLGCLRLTLGQLRLAEQAFAHVHNNDRQAINLAAVALARGDNRGVVTRLASRRSEDLASVSLLVRAGALAEAERLLRTITSVPLNHARWAADEIDEAKGNMAVVHKALATGVPWTEVMNGFRAFLYSETLARAAARAGDTAGAIRILTETGTLHQRTYTGLSHSGYFWMRTQFLLADLYRSQGKIAEARAIERDLLAALSAADTDHPMLIELQRRSR